MVPRTYTGLTGPVAKAYDEFKQTGMNPDPSIYNISSRVYFHRQEYPVAGQATPFTFFGANVAQAVTNYPGASGLSPNTAFLAYGFGFVPEMNADVNGAVVAGAECLKVITASTDQVFAEMEAIRGICQQGDVLFKIGNREIAAGYGLEQFPGGAGVNVQPAVSTNHGTVSVQQAVNLTNGLPVAGNYFKFAEQTDFLPQNLSVLTVTFKTARAVTTKFVLRANLFGVFFQHNASS